MWILRFLLVSPVKNKSTDTGDIEPWHSCGFESGLNFNHKLKLDILNLYDFLIFIYLFFMWNTKDILKNVQAGLLQENI